MAITSTLVPFTKHIWQFFLCSFLFGIGAGAWITSYNVWLIEMWQKKAGQVLFLSQLMYGIGSVLGPLIDRPYLTGEIHTNQSDYGLYQGRYVISQEERKNKLVIPYMISGGVQIICINLLINCQLLTFNYFLNCFPSSFYFGYNVFQSKISKPG